MRSTPPIQRRLMAMMLLTSAAVLVLTGAALLIYELVSERREMTAQLQTLARVIAANSTAALAFRDPQDAQELLASLRSNPAIVAAALYDQQGKLFTAYVADAGQPIQYPGRAGADGFGFDSGYAQGFVPVAERPDQRLGSLFLRADMREIYQGFWFFGIIVAAALGASLLLAYMLSRLFQGSISRPLVALADTARAVSERGDFSVRALPVGDAEFRQLTDGVNRMLDRIDAQNSELRESEGRLRAVLNSALSAVVVMDGDGTIRDWNQPAEMMFGWLRHEVLHRPLADIIIPSRHREAHRRGLERYLAGGDGPVIGRMLELTALRRDGSEFPVEVSITVVNGAGGVSFCGFLTDITERQLARKKLQAQLARLDLLQRTTRAIGERQDLHSIFQVILRNLEDNLPIDFGCVARYDAASHTLTVASVGVKSADTAAQLQIAVGTQLPIDSNGFGRCVRGVLVYEAETANAHTPLPQSLARLGLHSLVAAPMLVESDVFGVLIAARAAPDSFGSADCEFLRQLSEHVALAVHQVQLYAALQQAYEELRQSQQTILQQERLRALGQMASGVAHDINNAISPVALYTESLLEREPNLSERARDYLHIIQRAIGDVSQTVARMREFYRQRDRQADLQPIDLNTLVGQVIEMTRARWHDVPQERGVVIRTHTELARDLPKVMGIESDVRDALTNLIFNAVDAMPAGGTLGIRTSFSDPQRAAEVDLELSDTGAGMDEETRRRCLEPFFTTKGERGTGMGLAMVYGTMKRHGGQIDIDSAPGRGTTVRLTFVAATTSAGSHVHEPVPVGWPRPLRLLVIDDDPLVGRSLSQVLSSEGHIVTLVDGGQAGIDAFSAAHERAEGGEPFDIVITDLGMPYVDGRSVAAAIKQRSANTPVLLLTGWGQRLATENSVPANVDCVLSKPPKLPELRRAFADLLSGKMSLEGA